jgi:small-conductance mechanosensitive channel
MADLPALINSITLGGVLAFFLTLGIVTFIAYLFYKGAKALLLRYTPRSFARWSARIAGYLVFAILIYIIDLMVLGLDLNATVASLGILSIALAFASQQIISNLLAGLLIAVNRTIRLDDWVEIGGDPATGIAQVKDMTFTRTILQDRDGRVFMIPNASLFSSKIVNYSKSGFIEVPVEISLPISIPVEKVQSVILAVLAEHPDVLPKELAFKSPRKSGMGSSFFFQGYTGKKADAGQLEPRVLVTGYSHVAALISIRFWIADPTRKEEITSEVLADIGNRLNLPALA